MKTKMFCLMAFIIVFAGCDKIKDAATVPVTTKLKADIPVVVTSGAKSEVELNALAFTKTHELKLADNTDIAPYLSKIKEINLNSLVVTVTGLTAGQTINSVSLEVTGVGNIFTQTNITMSNNSFTPVIASGTLTSVAAKLTSDKKITLVVTGNASGPMSFTVGLNFDTKIIAYVL